MCLTSYMEHTSPSRQPIAIIRDPKELEVTDSLVWVAQDLFRDAPAILRNRVTELIGPENMDQGIPFVSVARFAGIAERHAEAVRLLVCSSTIVDYRPA